MSRKTWNGFSIVLVAAGIIIGMILASGLGLTGNVNADYPAPLEETGGDNNANGNNDFNPNASIIALSNAFADVAEKVNPAVVTISTETTVNAGNNYRGTPLEYFFRRMPEDYKQRGLGSGVIIDSKGIIVTNNHVIENADDIYVRLIDGRKLKATVKGTDPRTDLAIITIDAADLPFLQLGNSDDVRVGEWVLALGSPLEEDFHHTVTSGIVSAKGRTGVGLTQYEDFIQTDAAINPGNSGGALVNLKGELIGINTAIASRSGGSIGIGFAVPSNLVNKVKSDILNKGRVVRGWLGIEMDLNGISPELAEMYNLETNEGVMISAITENGPAEKAGLEPGDIVTKIDDKKIRNFTELSTRVGSTEPGTELSFTVNREGRELVQKVVIGEFPEDDRMLANQRRNGQGGVNTLSNLGIEVRDLNDNLRSAYGLRPRDEGIIVTSLMQNSVLEQAGIQEGDLIMKINRQYVENTTDFRNALGELSSGAAAVLYIKRDDRRRVIDFVMPR